MWTLLALFLGYILLIPWSHAQVTICDPNDKVYRALLGQTDGYAQLFCQEYLDTVSLVGTLRNTFTLLEYTTITDSSSQQPVTIYSVTTVRSTTTSTSYSSQARRTPSPTAFTSPLPSFVEQFPRARVSTGCSCIVSSINTYVQYRNCERSTDEFTTTTLTYTTGKPGRKTKTVTYTDTRYRTISTNAPWPAKCPNADNVDYVAKDNTVWERGCKTYLNCYRPIDHVHADSFNDCIDKCVEYNEQRGYKQCQAIEWGEGKGKNCFRVNSPCYFAHPDGGGAVATLRFYTPSTTESDYCATVSGAAK